MLRSTLKLVHDDDYDIDENDANGITRPWPVSSKRRQSTNTDS